MPSTLPIADPAPADGLLPPSAAEGSAQRRLGVYLHVPFCAVRCGYCDFNTYTTPELGPSDLVGASRATFAAAADHELARAAQVLAASGIAPRQASTVFVGGGTPTLLPSSDLAAALGSVRERLGLASGAEVTTEANPDSVTAESLAELAAAGFTRVSFGMQSAVPHVLATLERTHDPERVPQAVRWARQAGLVVSLDLIYGTPGESPADWQASLEAALACRPDHVSAYALVVEPGTAMAARVRRGELAAPDDDHAAACYEAADAALSAAGYRWYEVSNFARGGMDGPGACRHNLAYWRGQDWWGVGPGAHSHVGGVRWWNAKHPAAWARRLADGVSPAAGRETLTPGDRAVEAGDAGGAPVRRARPRGPGRPRPGPARRPRSARAGQAGRRRPGRRRSGRGRRRPGGAHPARSPAGRRGGARPARLVSRLLGSRGAVVRVLLGR